jgi:tetratricopeptide (TPR) repeat protein
MELTIEQALQRAVEAHKAGKLQDAEALYRAILQTQPNQPDANHNLGVMAVSLNKTAAALPLFKIALEANPNQGQFWLSYVDALIKENQFEEAKNLLEQGKKRGLAGEKVVILETQLIKLDTNLKSQITEPNKLSIAIELREMGRYQVAQHWLTKFLEVEPSDAEGWSLLSQLFLLDKKDVQAEKAIETAILINPNIPSIYRNQARLLLKNSKPAEALLKAQYGFEKSTEDPESWIVLAACLGANQRDLEALPLIERALKARPNYAEAFVNKGLIRLRAKNSSGAIEDFEKACDLKPHLTQIWDLLGSLYYENRNLSGAIEALKKAQALEPDNVNRMINLGDFLRQDKRIEEAIAILEEATEKAPENASAWINLGTALQQDNKIETAQAAYKKALAINPNSAEVCNNLGSIAKDTEDWESARKYFEQAITFKPNLAEVHSNLGIILKELGRLEDAFSAVIKSIRTKPTVEAKNLFIAISKKLDIKTWDPSLSQLIITALLEPWGRPADVMPFALRLLSQNKEFAKILDHLNRDINQNQLDESLFVSSISEKEFDATSLVQAMLTSTPIPDHQLETFFTTLRKHLLKVASSVLLKEGESDDVASLYCSIAQQCFINEYVYFQTTDEIDSSQQLRSLLKTALEDDQNIPSAWVIAVACYFPLYSVAGTEKLLQKNYSTDIYSVLVQQIQEPLEELDLRKSILSLTGIENKVSLKVQSQYEENPYPRWTRLPKDSSKKYLNSYIQSKFPLAGFQRLDEDRSPELLIAGCGTGQHSISTSQLIKGAKILAVDLSMASLSYAKRKTAELNIDSIEYAQADLLKLNSLGRTFDVIESSGVLHHLENPFEGWEVLLSLLKPYGLMRLGFYSEIARRDIVRVRKLISSAGIGSSSQDIRAYRKDLLGSKNLENYGFATNSSDFFSTSACRDLLFHVQEHRMTLRTLDRFFKDHDLTFLGFEIDSSIIQAYKKRFLNDISATNLEQWHIYEEETPGTFLGMYQFWVQKT